MRREKWTGEEDAILRENYGKVRGAEEWAKLLPRRSHVAIWQRGAHFGLQFAELWQDDEIEILRRNYELLGPKGVSKLLPSRSRHKIVWKAFDLGLKFRGSLNREFFRDINLTSCYWAGFLAADGCVEVKTRNQCVVSISSHVRDADHIRLFADMVGAGVEDLPARNGGSAQVRMRISSVEWGRDLEENFSITPRKSFTLQAPMLTNESALAFIIGYLDGDGSISTRSLNRGGKSLVLFIVGTENMLSWIRSVFISSIPSAKIEETHVRKHASIFAYKLSGKRAEAILKMLKNIDCPHLPRKWDKVT